MGLLFDWIPACAGMTKYLNQCVGLMKVPRCCRKIVPKVHKSYSYIYFFMLLIHDPFPCMADASSASIASEQQITSVVSEFVQEKHMKILVRPLISKGIFYYQAPDSLRWEYTSPVQSILISHENISRKFIRKQGELVEDMGGSMQSMQMILKEISPWLTGRIEENQFFYTSAETDHCIVLLPREKGLSEMIQRIELITSDLNGLVSCVTIYESKDSYTKMVFDHPVINNKIPDKVFTVK